MTDAERYAALIVALDAAAATPIPMPRDERRGFQRQASLHHEYADRMIEDICEIRTATRNAAIEEVKQLPFEGDFTAFLDNTIATVEARQTKSGHSHRIGLGALLEVLGRARQP